MSKRTLTGSSSEPLISFQIDQREGDIRTRDNVLPPTRTAQKAGNRWTSKPVRMMCSAESTKEDSLLSCSGAFHLAFCLLTRCRDKSVKRRGSTAEAYPMRYARSTGRSRGGTDARARALAIREGLAGAPLLPIGGLGFSSPRSIQKSHVEDPEEPHVTEAQAFLFYESCQREVGQAYSVSVPVHCINVKILSAHETPNPAQPNCPPRTAK